MGRKPNSLVPGNTSNRKPPASACAALFLLCGIFNKAHISSCNNQADSPWALKLGGYSKLKSVASD